LTVTLGVVLDPSPKIIAGFLHSELGLPVELLVGEGRVGSKIENVSLSSGTDLVGKVATNDLAEGVDNFKDGAATAGSQVPCLDTRLVLTEVVKGHQVTSGKVDDVDVVSNGSAVARGVVIAKHKKLLTLASGDLSEEGQKVERNTLRVLTHDATGVSTARIKVSQQSTVPLLKLLACLFQVAALSLDKVGDDVLDHRLGAAVGVGRSDGAVLRDGNHVGESGSIAVDGSGGGENNVVDVVALHGTEERDATTDIDAVVLERDFARLADSLNAVLVGDDGSDRNATCLEGSKVNDAINGRVLGKDLIDSLFVCDIELVKGRAATTDQLNAVEGDL
jgi:hypothetical protein